MRLFVPLLCAIVGVSGCVSFDIGTKNLSRTVKHPSTKLAISSIALLSAPDSAAAEGLSDRIEESLVGALQRTFTGAHILSPEEFGNALLHRKGYLQHFGSWRTAYQQTKVMDPKPLPHYAKVSGTRYLLLLRAVHLDREEVAFADVQKSGCCFANLSKKFWRANLSLSAELIDAENARVVWRGTGEASHLNRGGGESTYSRLGGLKVHHKNPEIDSFLDELVSVATNGVVQEIVGNRRIISSR